MNRRELLRRGGAFTIIGLAGCAGPVESNERQSGVSSHSFKKLSPDETPDEPELTNVSMLSDGTQEITIQGTVSVRNGCIDIRLGSEPEMTSDSDPVRVETMIGTYKPDDSDMCTQAIKPIGYELRITCYPPAHEVVIAQAGVNSDSYTVSVESTGDS